MTATEPHTRHEHVVQRYLPGSRRVQLVGLVLAAFLAAATLVAAWRDASPALAAAAAVPLLGVAVIAAFRFRTVTYFIAPETRRLRREAFWAGVCLSRREMSADAFTGIRIGWWDGGGESTPVYWAQLVGRQKWTLVESGREAEVRAAAREAGRLLGLPVR